MAKGVPFVLLGWLASGAAQAHTGVHAGEGLFAGLAHPFAGIDHLLAMVAVGLWATQLGGRRLLAFPATFVAAMIGGAALGALGVSMPLVEIALALSVLVVGLLVTLEHRKAWAWAVPLIGALGLVHGQAHGMEMPAVAAPWLYFAGFTLATAMLHALGMGGGLLLKHRAAGMRAAGAAIAFAGLWLVAAA